MKSIEFGKKELIMIRIILFSILLFFVLWIFFKGIVPFGFIKYDSNSDKKNSFISAFYPNTRLGPKKDDVQTILANPIYFNLRTPRKFDEAIIGIHYRSENFKNSIIEVGVLVDSVIWRYDLKPIQNKIIDDYCSTWDQMMEDNVLFCQKEKNYLSLNDFVNSTSSLKEIAIYNYKLNKDFKINEYEPAKNPQTISHSLKGDYQFYTYVKNEVLDFEFTLKDINKNKESDKIDVNLYYSDLLIFTQHLSDDGDFTDSNQASESRKLHLLVPDLPEGFYKIELRVNDDIITEQIKTRQGIIAFTNKINFYSDISKNIILYTDSNKIEAVTSNPDKLQNIRINNENLVLNSTFKQFSHRIISNQASSSLHKLVLEKDGVTLSGNGVFSFNSESLYNPNLKKVDDNLNIFDGDIKYIIADYKIPTKKDGWNYSEIKFDLSKAYRENRTYSFLVSAPGLTIDEKSVEYIEIKNIEVTLRGKKLFDLLKDFFER